MPCNLDGPGGRDYQYETELQLKADRAARAACEMARLIKEQDKKLPNGHKAIPLLHKLSTKTQKWIKRHEKLDRQRIADEKAEKKKKQLRARALAKLTKEERVALRGMQL